MASGIDVKMGVSGVSQFKSAMNQSSQSVKTLDAALKLNEKQLQATGDKETYMAQKSKLLQQQIAAQSNVVKQGQSALQAMERNGVDPASAAYQKLQQQVLNAQTALLGMQTDLSAVGQSAGETVQQTDKLTNSLNGINKKVNFDAVLNGIGKITDGMEAAAKKVSSMATDVWNTMNAAASWADSENTLAAMYGIDVETLQRMQGAARTIDTSVETIIRSRQKLKQSMASGTDAFKELGVSIGYMTGKGNEIQTMRDWEDVFWDVGEAMLNYQGDVDRDVLANQIFGKSWMELMPLFKAGREEYEKTMAAQSIVSEENVDKLNQLDDSLQKLDQEFQTLKTTVLSSLAPAFTTLADSVSGMLQQFNEYLETDEGKEKLQALGDAAARLFEGITDIDFNNALETAKGWLDGITGALGWIGEHWNDVATGIKAIGGAFLGLKLAEVVGTLAQGALALKNLMGGGAASAAGQGAAAAAGGSLLGKAAKGVGSFLGSAAGKLSGVLGGVMIANEIMYGNPFQWYAISGNDDIYGENGIYKPGSPEYQAWIAEQEQFAREVEAANKVRAQVDKDQSQGRARTEAEWIRIEEAREKAWQDEQMAKMKAEAAEYAAELERQYQEMMAETVPSWAEVSGQVPVNESPEDKMARIFGFSNDQELVDAYSQFMKSTAGQNPYEMFGITVDDYRLFGKMAAEAQQRLKVPAEPEFSPNVAQELQDQLSGVELHVWVTPEIKGTGYFGDDGEEDVVIGGHANGLPFVPFDGYIAALHRGERVMTASQNRSYTTNSNVYFDHVNVGGGVDADGLAARIAERTRRAMSGFGG